MYMSGKHAAIEKVFLRLPEKARIPAVYIALCQVGKIRRSAIENRLSAMKLFAGTNVGRAARELDAEDEDEDEEDVPRVPRPAPAKVKRPERAAESRPKRSWEEDFEAALKADEEVAAKARAEKAAKKPKDDEEEDT